MTHHYTTKRVAILAASFEENAHEKYLTKIYKQYYPFETNEFWEALFVDKFAEILENAKNFTQIRENKLTKIEKNYHNYGVGIAINLCSQSYPKVSKILVENKYKFNFFSMPNPEDISSKYGFGKFNLIVSIIRMEIKGDSYSVSEILKIIKLLKEEILEITISYNLKSNTLLFNPIISEKRGKKNISNFDVSDSFSVEKFLEICNINNINDKDSLKHAFPNINPKKRIYSEEEEFEELIKQKEHNEWIEREYINAEYIKQANRDFYSEFGDHFHEDML